MKNYHSVGNSVDYTNGTGSAIASGDVVVIAGVIGVAAVDIAVGATGAVAIEGVFSLPKVSGAVIGQGETIFWDVSAGAFDDNAATPATGDIKGAGAIAIAAAGNGVTSVKAKLNPGGVVH